MNAPVSKKKKVEAYIKLQIPTGKANPSPPVGPALGQRGVNIMEFARRLTQPPRKWNKAFLCLWSFPFIAIAASRLSSKHHRPLYS